MWKLPKKLLKLLLEHIQILSDEESISGGCG